MEFIPLEPSRFNSFCELRSQNLHLVYNSRSGGVASVAPWLYEKLRRRTLSEEDLTNPAYRDMWQSLAEGGILVGPEVDELESVRTLLELHKFSSRTLHLTIAPTLDCNLACRYCYQSADSTAYMDRDTEDAILTFVSGRHEEFRYGNLSVSWFGGEPLMCVPTIESLSQKLQAFCTANRLSYAAGAVTNGTLLGDAALRALIASNVRTLQVTIDGPKPIHDRRRPYKHGLGGGSTFEDILRNITNAYGRIRIGIRVNVDKTNPRSAQDVLAEFKERGLLGDASKLSLGLGHARDASPGCMDPDECLTRAEFLASSLRFDRQLSSLGVPRKARLPEPKMYCGATSLHSFVIEPGGYYHKCWTALGNQAEYIGNVRDPLVMNRKMVEWLQYDALRDSQQCRECGVLPVCVGGCPYTRLRRPERFVTDPCYSCSEWRLALSEQLRSLVTNGDYEAIESAQ